jgi:hypothetical protein
MPERLTIQKPDPALDDRLRRMTKVYSFVIYERIAINTRAGGDQNLLAIELQKLLDAQDTAFGHRLLTTNGTI